MLRRTLLWGLPALATGWLAARGGQKDGTTSGVDVDVNIGNEKPDTVVGILRQVDAKNVQQVKENGLGGIETIVACVIVAKGLANLISRLLSTWSSGVVVDARSSRISVEKDRKLPRGTVRVISPDGARTEMSQPSVQQIEARVEKFARPK